MLSKTLGPDSDIPGDDVVNGGSGESRVVVSHAKEVNEQDRRTVE
jgi:hypothetical protein